MEKKIYTPNDIDIERLSSLSKLSLTDSEKESFSCDIASAANYICSLLEDVEADYEREALALCELREDTPSPCDAADAILSLSPDGEDRYVRVPRAVGRATEVGK